MGGEGYMVEVLGRTFIGVEKAVNEDATLSCATSAGVAVWFSSRFQNHARSVISDDCETKTTIHGEIEAVNGVL